MSDFYREVDEDYRRERLVKIWTAYQSWFIAAAVLIVVATAGYRIYKHFKTEAAEAGGARYEAALQLAAEGKSAEAQAAFEAIGRDGPKGYATLARLRAADEIGTRDRQAAASAYDALAAAPHYPQAFKDMAQARAAMLRVDSEDPQAFEQKYGALAGPTFTYRNTIRELLALSAFRRNDVEAAGRWLDMIVSDSRAPAALRQRAEAFLTLVQAGKAPPERAVALPTPGLTASPAGEAPAAPAISDLPPPKLEEPAASAGAAQEPARSPVEPPKAEAAPETAAPLAPDAAAPTPAPEPAPAQDAPAKSPEAAPQSPN